MTDQYNNKATDSTLYRYCGRNYPPDRRADIRLVATIGTTGTLMGWPGGLRNITRMDYRGGALSGT
ncbi:MAG: hypothetical protein R2874_01660 [Desulfobacterales bacterium]